MIRAAHPKDARPDGGRTVFWPAHPGGVHAARPDDPDGPLIHVEDAPRGASGLLCPECRHELVAKKGAVRIHHFAHRGGTGGEDAPDCPRAGETALHRMAKEIIAEAGYLLLPKLVIRTPDGPRTIREATRCAFEETRLEPREPGMRPDLIAYFRSASGAVARLAVEIHVTHRVAADKCARFAALDLPAVEINLSTTRRSLDRPALAALILHAAPRSWLYERKSHAVQMRADAEASDRRRAHEAEAARVLAERNRDRRTAEHAMRDILRDRKKARRETRRGTDLETRAWADATLADWSGLCRIGAVKMAGPDHPFEAESAVWRAVVLARLATWPPGGTSHDLTPTAVALTAAAALRSKGFVKAGYMRAVPDPPGGQPSGDPVRDACRGVLEAVAAGAPGGTLAESLEAMRNAYRFALCIRDSLREIAARAAARGAVVTLRGATVGMDVSWRTARHLAEPQGDRHPPSPSDLRTIAAALCCAAPQAPPPGRGSHPVLSAAARLHLALVVGGEDRTEALLDSAQFHQMMQMNTDCC